MRAQTPKKYKVKETKPKNELKLTGLHFLVHIGVWVHLQSSISKIYLLNGHRVQLLISCGLALMQPVAP